MVVGCHHFKVPRHSVTSKPSLAIFRKAPQEIARLDGFHECQLALDRIDKIDPSFVRIRSHHLENPALESRG